MSHTVAVEQFEPTASALRRVRRFVRHALGDAGVNGAEGDLADLVLLVANELATNAALHARTEYVVALVADEDRVRVEVRDGNTRVPQPCLAPPDATSGRGLVLIDASGMRWGVERHDDGKTVWAEARRG